MKKLFQLRSLVWLIGLVILIIGATNIIGCSKIDNKDINKSILDTIAEIEKSNYELNTLKITYDEYSQRTDKFLSKYFTSFYKSNDIIYADKDFVLSYTGKQYAEKDWKGITLDKLKEIGERLSQSLAACRPGLFYTSYDLSKVYDDNNSSDTSMHYKHIFIRHMFQDGNQDYTIYKKYVFKREDNKYVLFGINSVLVEQNKELKYGNEVVEFVQNTNLE